MGKFNNKSQVDTHSLFIEPKLVTCTGFQMYELLDSGVSRNTSGIKSRFGGFWVACILIFP